MLDEERIRERRWWALFGAVHAPRGSKLRAKAEAVFFQLSEQLQADPNPGELTMRPSVESRPFVPGLAPIDTSGWCLGCGAIRYGGCTVDVYGVTCSECGESKVVGRSDADLLRCIDIEIVDPQANGPPRSVERGAWYLEEGGE